MAYVASTPATGQTIYLRSLDALGARIVPGTEGALYAFWSPDGKSLGFTTRAGFKRVDLARGAPRILSTLTHGSMNGTWNQQGDVLFYPSQDPPPVVQRISASGGPVTRVTRLDEARGETSHRFPKFLPDGRRFLFFAYNRDPSRNSVELATLGSFERKTVLEGVSASVFAQAPGGKAYLLYTRDGILFAHRFDESEGAVLGEPVVLASDVGGSGTDNLMPNVSVSDSGTLVYCSGSVSSPGRLAWFDRQGRMLSELPPEAAGLNATLSPDGRMLAVHRFDETRRVADIWVTDLARSVTTRLTFSQGGGQYPVWSPDGKQIIYRTTKNGQPELNQKDASGSGEERLVVVGNLFPMGWFRDGTHLVVRGATVRASDLSVLPLERDRKPIPLATAYTTAASVSPDGKLIAYDSLESGEREVFVISMPPAIGKWQVSSGGGSQPAWRGDGKELYFLAADSSMMAVDVQFSPAFSHGAPRRLFPSGVPVGSTGSQYAPTADGQRFLIRLPGEDSGTPITVVHNWWAELKQ